MPFCSNCGQQLTIGTEKFCPNCGQDLKGGGRIATNDKIGDSFNIQGTGGDVIGVGVRGSGNVIGKNITGNISVSQATYNKLEPEFKNSLEEFLGLINKKSGQLTEEQRGSLKESIDALAKEAEGLKTGEVVKDEDKLHEIKSKQLSLAEKIVDYLPEVAESIASATPLAPFSKSIGKGAGYFAEWIKKKLNKK